MELRNIFLSKMAIKRNQQTVKAMIIIASMKATLDFNVELTDITRRAKSELVSLFPVFDQRYHYHL